ncbi:hypothetical protein LCGC14_2237220 [marine sediment metagenome]|uniref:Phage protein n=1 Tax=marine sediment metagenome TaxID=412755 RepID=A0A0F9G1L3_9ZZZZ
MKFRKKPVVVEAGQFLPDVRPWPKGVQRREIFDDHGEVINVIFSIVTIHSGQSVDLEPGDWVLLEPDGRHYYPCKPEIFEKTYERVEE